MIDHDHKSRQDNIIALRNSLRGTQAVRNEDLVRASQNGPQAMRLDSGRVSRALSGSHCSPETINAIDYYLRKAWAKAKRKAKRKAK